MTLTKQSIEPGYTHPEPSSNGFVAFLVGASTTLLLVVLMLIPLTLLGFETPFTNPVLLVFLFIISIAGIAWSGAKMTRMNYNNQVSEQEQFKDWVFKRYGLTLTTEQLELLVMGQGVVVPNSDGVLERYSLRYDSEREESFLFSEKEVLPVPVNNAEPQIVDANFELFAKTVPSEPTTVVVETSTVDVIEVAPVVEDVVELKADGEAEPNVPEITVVEEAASVVEETPVAVEEVVPVKPARQPRKRTTAPKAKATVDKTVVEDKPAEVTVEAVNPAPKRRGRPPKAAVTASDTIEASAATDAKPAAKRAPAKRTTTSTKNTGTTTAKPRTTTAKKPTSATKTAATSAAVADAETVKPTRKPRASTATGAKTASTTSRKPATPRKPRTKPAAAGDVANTESTESE